MENIEIWPTLTQAMLDTIKTKQNYAPQTERWIVLEGELLFFVLENPECYPRDYVEKFRASKFNIGDFIVTDALKRVGLYNVAARVHWARSITSEVESLKSLIAHPGEEDSVGERLKDISTFLIGAHGVSDTRRKGGVLRKAFLICLSSYLEENLPQIGQSPELLKEVKRLSFLDTRKVVLRLFNELATCFGIQERVTPTKDLQTSIPLSDQEVKRSELSDVHEYLSDGVEWLEAEIEIEKEDVEKRKQDVPYWTAKNFFAKLNSEINGNLLDLVDKTVLNLEENPSQVEEFDSRVRDNLVPLIKKMRQFFDAFGLKRKEPVGKILTISLEDVDEYEYSGSPFTNEDSIKKVRVETPGWEYKTIGTVGRAVVREVNE